SSPGFLPSSITTDNLPRSPSSHQRSSREREHERHQATNHIVACIGTRSWPGVLPIAETKLGTDRFRQSGAGSRRYMPAPIAERQTDLGLCCADRPADDPNSPSPDD